MTKAGIIIEIAHLTQQDQEKIGKVIPALLSTIVATLAEGENVFIGGFGTFNCKLRNKTTGRNVSRNTPMIIPAHYIPHFKPYQDFKREVKSGLP
jgi:DNA-binding protein HU-beta